MRRILLAATALAVLSGAAVAQTSTSGSASNATNTSGSQSSSISNPRVTVSGNPIGNGTSSSSSGAKSVANTRSSSGASANPTLTSSTATNVYVGGSGQGSSGLAAGTGVPNGTDSSTTANLNTHYSGGYTVRNTPEVIAPNVMGGNPCAVGASGGLALPGFGLSAGGTWADKACERRQQAALLFNMGEQGVARELMCQDDQVRRAMISGGKPCVADTTVAQAAVPAAQASAPPLVAPPISLAAATPPAAANLPARAVPEWCSRAAPSTEASKAYVASVCS